MNASVEITPPGDPAGASSRPSTLPLLGAAAVLALPLAVLAWLLRLPLGAPSRDLSFEHLVVVGNVALLALLVSVLIAASALQQKAFRPLLLALGFLSMSGFFAVHALATPGVLLPASGLAFTGGTYHQEHGAASVLGISAYLSVLAPSLFFAARYLPFNSLSTHLAVVSRVLAGGLVAVLVAYAALGLRLPDTLALLPLLQPPFTYLAAGLTVALLMFSAWRQSGEFLATRLPMQAALVAAYLLLADAQVAMVVAPVWSLAWWEYHVLMLAAVLCALAALFVELDRRRGLERFLSPAVVERVMSGSAIRLGGERRVVTILFADLRNSTSLAEQLPAEAVVDLLNSYVGAMARCVFDQGGILDKFLGDGLMAIFGAVPDRSHGAEDAIRTVRAIRQAMAELNQERAAGGRG
ncbi:MAG: adenylate/guanylate cyclase domain-containing protein, partial [Chloroflexota bacterium]